MSRYVTQFIAEVCPRLSGAMKYDITDASIGVTTSVLLEPRFLPDPAGTPFPAGVCIDVECEAPDLDVAFTVGAGMADLMVVLMNLVEPGWTERPKPYIGYRLDGPAPREVVVFTDGWMPGPPTRKLDEVAFTAVVGAWLSLPEESQWRTSHAANNLRLALRDDDAADRLPTTYSGLEFLNPLLDGRFKYTGRGSSLGLGGFIEARQGAAFEEQARLARNGIVHGKKAIADLATDIASVDSPLVQVLRDAVFTEVGVTASSWTPSDLNSPTARGRLLVKFVGELTPNAAGDVAPPGFRHPVVEQAEMTVTTSWVDSDGKYHAQGTPRYNFGLAEGATLHITSAHVPMLPGAQVELSNPLVAHASTP
jgi:hypothetical protein